MDPSFRFLHASDLHLELPPGGLAEVPDHLRGALVDAPYRAAERVFDAALKHHVDFVVLAGDIVDPQAAGPRAIAFLNGQFERLAQAGVRVYWAGSPSDGFETWGDVWPLGENVTRLPLGRVEHVIHYRAGEALALIVGTSCNRTRSLQPAAFRTEDELFAVAAAYGQAEDEGLAAQGIDYWALGGEHTRRSLVTGAVTAPLLWHAARPCGRRSGPARLHAGPRRRSGASAPRFCPPTRSAFAHEHISRSTRPPRSSNWARRLPNAPAAC